MQEWRGSNLFYIKSYVIVTLLILVIILWNWRDLSVHRARNYRIRNGLRDYYLLWEEKKFIHNLSALSNTIQEHNKV